MDVPLRIPKLFKKKTTRLDAEMAIMVPSTKGIKAQKNISKSAMEGRVNEVRKYFSNQFGGYTSVKAIGGYVKQQDGKLVKEKVTRVSSFGDKDTAKKHGGDVVKKAGCLAKKWQQETVGLEWEGDFYLVPPHKGKCNQK